MTLLEYMNKLQDDAAFLRHAQELVGGTPEQRLIKLENKICELEKAILMLNGCGR
jgi:hypothetical protein